MKYFVIVLLVLIAIFLAYLFNSNRSVVTINNAQVKIDIASTDQLRTKGLSGRSSLGELNGMLFVMPDETGNPFWMIDMKFPLDIIFLDKSLKVVDIKKEAQPCPNSENCPLIFPSQKYFYVLEVNSGFCDKYGLKIGDSIKTNLFTSVP